jgi:Bacterial PH domain
MKHATGNAGATRRTDSRQGFPLAPLPRMTWPLLLGLWVLLLLAGFLASAHQQSPHNPVPWWLVIIFGTALLPAVLASALAHRTITMEGHTLEIAGGLLFSRKLPVTDLALDKARVLSLDEHTEFKPMLQLGGFDLPGFKVGNYLLRNRKRAFCLLTARRNVLLLPQCDGKLILVSPEKPQALLDALRGH